MGPDAPVVFPSLLVVARDDARAVGPEIPATLYKAA